MKVNIKIYFLAIFFSACCTFTSASAQQDSTVEESTQPPEREFIFEELKEFSELLETVIEEDEKDSKRIELDSSKIALARRSYQKRVFDTIEINRYKSLDVFDYTEARADQSPFILWLQRIFRKLFGMFEPDEIEEETVESWFSFFNIIKYVVIILAAALLAWFLLKSEFTSLIKKKNIDFDPKIGDLDITIEEDVLLTSLQEAITKEDYRTAVRYKYLIVLKQLNEDQFINWKDYKLSSDYINEITDSNLQKEFRSLTEYFNYTWYGNYKVNRGFFDKAVTHFDSIKTKIS